MTVQDKYSARDNFDLGYIQTCLKNFDKAIVHFTRAIELDSEYAEAYNNRGLAYFILGRDVEAHADFMKAVNLQHKFELQNEAMTPECW